MKRAINEIGTLYDGPHATPERRNEGPYFLNIASLQNGRLTLGSSDHVSEADFARWTRRVQPEPGDLLFSYETRLGEAAMMPTDVRACLGRRMALLRPNRSLIEPRFLLYYYLAPEFQSLIDRNTIHGATVNRISLSTMGSWIVDVPALREQQAIAEVLGALDDKITANSDAAASCRELARLLGSRATSALPLSEIVTISNSARSPLDFSTEKVWLYSLPAFDLDEQPVVCEKSDIKSAKFILDEPCVLVSKLNPRFPRVWNIPKLHPGESVASTEFVVLKPSICSTGVLWALLSQGSFGSILEGKVAGTSGSHQRVRPADLIATEVGDPRSIPGEARVKIAALSDLGNQLGEESAHLARVRDELLPDLLSGRLRVRDAEHRVGEVV